MLDASLPSPPLVASEGAIGVLMRTNGTLLYMAPIEAGASGEAAQAKRVEKDGHSVCQWGLPGWGRTSWS